MTSSAGTKLGPYEIVAPLGAGGMGEVYRAKDSKLKREVAIKVLPDMFSRDGERIARFQREAEVLASLNHPHIAAIHNSDELGESRFLVMELVEGETLAQRLARGAMPLDAALRAATQIAEALEAAHDKGVIHRDLKPANIKITPDGKVKVLDFGLAKIGEAPGRDADLSNSPTISSMPGIILGTAAYMSPEQAKGEEAGRASDVWAFGCVLYEMLSARPVFEGKSAAEILGGVFKQEPDWQRLPAATPEPIKRLLRRCLQKEEKLRIRDMRDVRIDIEDVRSGAYSDGQPGQGKSQLRSRLVWVSAVVVAALVGAAIVLALQPSRTLPEMRVDITAPPSSSPASFAISPDGQKIVYAGVTETGSRLLLRSLDSVIAKPLTGTEEATFPFWSPDGRSIGFFAGGKLKRVDIDGSSLQILANVSVGRGGSWNREGVIIFAPAAGTTPVLRISATGGEPVPVTRVDPSRPQIHYFPQFLPDGRHFIYYVPGSPDVRGVYVGQLDGLETRRLFDADASAVYASTGQLLFVRQGTLFAQNFDASKLVTSGTPFAVAEQVIVEGRPSVLALSASAAGPLAYRAGSAASSGMRQLAWIDRSGKELEKIGPLTTGVNPAISPDGRQVALRRVVDGNDDIWLLDIGRSVLSRFTFDPANDADALWSPDAGRIVFSSNRKGAYDLYMKSTTGPGNEELLLASTQNKVATDWSPDGRFVVYRSNDSKMSYDIWALPIDGDRKPIPVVQTNFDERDAQFSPDGKWIAYQSNESGRFEIYVQPFGVTGNKLQVSTNGGAQVRWRRDGKELFYIALDGRLMAVPVTLSSNAYGAEAGTPVPLFVTHIGGAVQSPLKHQYVVSPDGQRFLMSTVPEEAAAPITVILNWKARR
jgi:eukaryotic-like serine/threonine-protein kinase